MRETLSELSFDSTRRNLYFTRRSELQTLVPGNSFYSLAINNVKKRRKSLENLFLNGMYANIADPIKPVAFFKCVFLRLSWTVVASKCKKLLTQWTSISTELYLY